MFAQEVRYPTLEVQHHDLYDIRHNNSIDRQKQSEYTPSSNFANDPSSLDTLFTPYMT